ncbi:hypothetical protein Q7C_2586 [Methylophaga frappieri]|uniref:Uncharacterized protein n=1 Tax=Methylophaga frappieri (strain ATCC BAA-2434 / DSM 25690 / JAM7) TaxID=754477 RepID=I1YLB4_METFJ|nr:hypothetical protein Q7C_2586 [Methylophaga frappieri]
MIVSVMTGYPDHPFRFQVHVTQILRIQGFIRHKKSAKAILY